jgi:hypothetical protein
VAAQRAVADSIQKTAESHEGAAKSYERVAGFSEHPEECLAYASRHRHFAREDRLFAEQLGKLAASWHLVVAHT